MILRVKETCFTVCLAPTTVDYLVLNDPTKYDRIRVFVAVIGHVTDHGADFRKIVMGCQEIGACCCGENGRAVF